MDCNYHKAFHEVVQLVIEHGPQEMAMIYGHMLAIAMAVEPEAFLGAQTYERTAARRADRNGYKPKRLDTAAGTVTVQVPKTAGHEPGQPDYPQALTRGRQAEGILHKVAAEMYVPGVSSRGVAKVLQACGIKSYSAPQVSRAVQQLEAKLAEWQARALGACPEVMVDARYERVRIDGHVQRVAVLIASGFGPDGQRQLLGFAIANSEAAVHWQNRLEDLVARGLHGVELVISDCHAGLRQAIQTVFPAAAWQRCQFHMTRNARRHAPDGRTRRPIGAELRAVWNRSDRAEAAVTLAALVARYPASAPAFARWLAANVPDGLQVFARPAAHRRRLRTTNMVERAVQQELKRRTRPVRSFPNVAALARMVGAVLVDIDEKWAVEPRPYLRRAGQNE